MVLPVADAINQVADNFKQHVEKIIQQVDAGLAKQTSFPYTIGFPNSESVDIILDVCNKYKAAGYNVKLVKQGVTETQKNAYVLFLNHSAVYTDTGSHILFKC